MKRLTEKYNDAENGIVYDLAPNNFSDDLSTHNAQCEMAINRVIDKLGKLEDLMEKYGFETVEDLDNFIQSCINRIEYESKKEKYYEQINL